MGMESFFIIILPQGVYHKKKPGGGNTYEGESKILYNDIKNIINQFPHILNKENYSINIMNKYLLKLFLHNGYINNMEIESCLYYLKNDKETIKNILLLFINNKLKIFHPSIGYLIDIDNFIDKIELFYKTKMEIFIGKYNHIFVGKNLLSGDFYKIITDNNFLIKIFKRIFNRK